MRGLIFNTIWPYLWISPFYRKTVILGIGDRRKNARTNCVSVVSKDQTEFVYIVRNEIL